jgi:hypothetical protein
MLDARELAIVAVRITMPSVLYAGASLAMQQIKPNWFAAREEVKFVGLAGVDCSSPESHP